MPGRGEGELMRFGSWIWIRFCRDSRLLISCKAGDGKSRFLGGRFLALLRELDHTSTLMQGEQSRRHVRSSGGALTRILIHPVGKLRG